MGLTLPEMFSLLYDLFVKYTFGNMELTIIGVFIMVSYIAWKMHVSADGWVLVLGAFGAVIGWYYLTPSGLPVVIAIGIGVLIYLLVRRIVR